MMQEKRKFQPLTSSDVCQIYELLHKQGLVAFPVTGVARNKIDALVASITGSYFGQEIYLSVEEKVVAYLYFLIKDHPFTDGNKRTASLTFSTLCEINGLAPDYNEFGLDELAVFIEKIQGPEHHEAIKNLADSIFPKSY